MGMYSKLASSIVHSSLWSEPEHVRILFVTLLALSDHEGFVWGSRVGLERIANIHYPVTDPDPWEVLLGPDPNSSDLLRNPKNEGRRIEEVSGGFRVLNYSYYRALRDEEVRRQQNREAQQRHRAKLKGQTPKSEEETSADVSNHKADKLHKPGSAHAESDTDTDTDTESEDVLSSKKEPKNDAEHRAVPAAPGTGREIELMGELRAILSKKEMEQLGGMWRKRIRHCSKAVAFAIEDFKLRQSNHHKPIKNCGMWLTDRYSRALVELLG